MGKLALDAPKLALDAPPPLVNLQNTQRRFGVEDLGFRTCTILKDGRLFAGSVAVVCLPLTAPVFRV